LLEALVVYFPAEPALWGEVLGKMIARICALDVQLTPTVFGAVQKAVKLFHVLLHSTPSGVVHHGGAKTQGSTQAGVLSHYDMFTELRHFVSEQDRGGQAHWTLETFQNILRIRKHNLSALLSVTGSAERCRMFGVHQAEETAIFYKVPPKHRMVDEKTLSSPRTTFVYSLVQMIVHRAPMDIIKAQISPFAESASGGSAAPTSVAPGGGGATGTASVQLTEAAVFRVCQLLEIEQPRGDMTNMNIEQFCDMWWGQWQNFSEELYAFVEDGLIDFGQFIMSLAKSQRLSTPARIKDNSVIWLIAQCLPLDNVKKLFVHDLTSNHGRLFLRMFEFHNAQQSDASGFELRDTALNCLIFRLYNARDAGGRNDLKSYLPATLQPLYERGTKAVLTYRQWWNETEKNGENLDFYNLPWTKLWNVCLLSNFTSSPISGAFFDAMNKQLEPIQQCYLPGQLVFRGRSQPIPTMYLILLSTRTRQRLLDLLEAHILRPRQTQADPYNNPAIVGTYARLLYAAPYSRNRFRLQKNLMSSEPTVLHVLIELLNFRLLRFFRYHSSIRHLYLHLHEVAMTTTHHMLFHSLENLLFKLSINLEEVIKFSKATTVINFGQSLNRVLILGLARQIKCRGVSSFSHFRQLPQLLSRLLTVTRHNWSEMTLKYFPESLRSFFQANQKPDPEAYTNKETVYHEFQAQEALLRGALGEDNPYSMNYLEQAPETCVQRLNEYYSSNIHPRKLFLSLIWILLRERDSSHAHNVLRVLQQFTPQDVTACNFALVDFILDTLQPQQLMFLPEPASPDLINQTGGLLAKLIWHYNIARFEIVLQALMDRDDDINAFSMIDYLLNQSPDFATRVEYWCSLGVRPDHWREQAYFTYHRQFHDKFPEPLTVLGAPALPTYYGNVCLRALPILDVLVGRLIENDQLHLLERLVSRYGQLWRYHDAPITFTCELLQYYHESEHISANMWKLNLLSLLQGVPSTKFSASFKKFTETRDVDLVSTDSYFRATVDHAADFLSTELPSNSKFHTTATLQIFEEFSDVCQEAVTTTLLELLLLPLSASDTTNKLLDVVLGPQPVPQQQQQQQQQQCSSGWVPWMPARHQVHLLLPLLCQPRPPSSLPSPRRVIRLRFLRSLPWR
jgi:mediator of RNA polymerase II transcription subunit 23